MTEVDMSTKNIPAPEVNYTKYSLERSQYGYNSFNQQTGQSTVTLGASSGQTSTFELPPGCYNLARTYLSFNASVYTRAGTTTYVNFNARGTPMILEISAQGKQSGTLINNIRYANRYVNTAVLKQTKITEALTRGNPVVLHDTTTTPLVANQYLEDGLTLAYTAGTTNAARPTGGAANRELGGCGVGEPAYIISSVVDSNDAKYDTIAWRISLATFFDSFFALDKTIYLPESLYIKIVWAARGDVYFTSTSATNPTTSAAAATIDVSISNLKLNACVEENSLIAQKLMNDVNSGGMEITIGSVESAVQSISGTSQSCQTRYSSIYGGKLKKIYFACYNATETINTAFDSDVAIAASRLVSYYVNVNNNRLNRSTYIIASSDDWNENRLKLKGSCVTSMNAFYYNWSYLMDWTNNYSTDDDPVSPPTENFNDGLPLDTEKRIDLVATTANGTYNWYTFACLSRTLILSSKGIFLK